MSRVDNKTIIKDFIFDRIPDMWPQKTENINDCVFICEDEFDNLVFYNEDDESTIEVSEDFQIYHDIFAIVIEKISPRMYNFYNSYESEISILKYKLKKVGIENFNIKYKEDVPTGYEKEGIYELKFKSNADSAAFQLYFAKYFNYEKDYDSYN